MIDQYRKYINSNGPWNVYRGHVHTINLEAFVSLVVSNDFIVSESFYQSYCSCHKYEVKTINFDVWTNTIQV